MPPWTLRMRWPDPDPRVLPLAREAAISELWLPCNGGPLPAEFVAACRRAGVALVADLTDAAGLEDAARAGFTAAAFAAPDETSARRSIARRGGLELYVYLKPEQVHWNLAGARPLLRAGLWPGSRRPDPSVASATQAAWLDANSYLIAWLRCVAPDRKPLLGYRPDADAGVDAAQRVPYGSVELALAEAAALGGQIVLTLPNPYRTALLAGEPHARRAWSALLQTASLLRTAQKDLSGPIASRVAVVATELEDCGEILNLLFRHSVSPRVVPPHGVPAFGSQRVLVAVGLGRYAAAARAALAFARDGGKVLTAPASAKEAPWWPHAGVKKIAVQTERDVYAIGKGQIFAYREPVSDPNEFALDVIDALGWRTRDLRIWGTTAVIGILHEKPRGLWVELLSYSERERDFLVRVEGRFPRAILHRPGSPPQRLRAVLYGSGTEIEIPGMSRFARLALEAEG